VLETSTLKRGNWNCYCDRYIGRI